MKTNEKVNQHTGQVTRRALLRSLAATTALVGAGGLAEAGGLAQVDARSPATEYGDGQTPLKPETVFPLFAAWLLISTNPPFLVDEDLVACAARLGPTTAKQFMDICRANANKLSPARKVFKELAIKFSGSDVHALYHGGQCPHDAETVTPVAALLGTPTTPACKSPKPLAKGKKKQ